MQRIDRIALVAAAGLALLFAVSGCDVKVKDKGGKNEKVDIETPAGSIHVNKSVDIAETGLSAYPGAKEVPTGSHDNDSANVSLEGPNGEGLHIVVLHYASDDAPDKVLGFYRDQMKKYGAVTECKGDLDYNGSGSSRSTVCHPNGSGKVALAVGRSEDNQRIVSVKPKDKGSEFDVVYLRMHGESGTI